MYWSSPPRNMPSSGYYESEYRSPQPTSTYYTTPPKYNVIYTTTPSGKERGHNRRASYEPSSYAYNTSARQQSSYYTSPGGHQSAADYAYSYATPKRPSDHVSSKEFKARPYVDLDDQNYRGPTSKDVPSSKGRSQTHRVYVRTVPKSQHVNPMDAVDEDDEGYSSYETIPPPFEEQPRYFYYRSNGRDADYYYHNQAPPEYRSSAQKPSHRHRASTGGVRARASSTTQKPTRSSGAAAAAAAADKRASARPATAADALKHGIPAGYQYKNWDPEEEPILLLGSVFDANSIGKWIYDWTVFRCGAATPMSDVAGELWLLLIELAGKIKRAEETFPRVRRTDDRELIEEFLESGERLWVKFNNVLRVCEGYMWKYMKREKTNRTSSQQTMTSNSGCIFVDAIFGRDRELENTEKLMTGIRLWSMRFDANCDDIIRHARR